MINQIKIEQHFLKQTNHGVDPFTHYERILPIYFIDVIL